jgi:hypothetical protein
MENISGRKRSDNSTNQAIGAIKTEPTVRSSLNYYNSASKIKRKHLINNQFPDTIQISEGFALNKPIEWA